MSLSGVAAGVTAGAPPVSMFHGDNDTTVPYASAVDSCNAAKAIGNRCDFTTYPGIGHDIYSRYGDWMPEDMPPPPSEDLRGRPAPRYKA